MFEDRFDAGRRLAGELEEYRSACPLVLGIPRGGAIVGYEVARHINAEFSVIVARKLPIPGNPEAGFGAIAEDGTLFIMDEAKGWVGRPEIDRIVREQQQELSLRLAVLRGGRPLPEIKGRLVILVDDGIAMGSTMRACILACRKKSAAGIVVAAPVCGVETARLMEQEADRAVILEMPENFRAVALSYRRWTDVTDEEVLRVLQKSSG